MRLRSASPWGSLEEDRAQNGPGSFLQQSGPALQPTLHSQRKEPKETPPKCSEMRWMERSRRGVWLLSTVKRRGWRGKREQLSACQLCICRLPLKIIQPAALVRPYSPPPPTTAVSDHSLRSLLHQPPPHPTPSLFIFTAPLSCPTQSVPVDPSTPSGLTLLTRVLLELLRPWLVGGSRGPRPAGYRVEGRGTRTTHSAAQPHPCTHGRGVA